MLDQEYRFSSKNICKILVARGLLSKEQAMDVLKRDASAIKALEAKNAEKKRRDSSGTVIETPVTFADVLVALKIKRIADPSKILDEDSIYEAMAEGFGMVYKKIDPLKLELNLVTKTIPRSFAMKHLLLPLEMDGDRLAMKI